MLNIKNIPQILILSLASLLAFSSASNYKLGRCSSVPLKANFDVSQYVGIWYNIAYGDDISYTGPSKCNQVKYTARPDGKVSVYNWALRENGKEASVKGYAVFNNGAAGKVYFFNIPA